MTTPDEEPALPEAELSELAPSPGPADGKDPSNTELDQIVDPLDDADDVHIQLSRLGETGAGVSGSA